MAHLTIDGKQFEAKCTFKFERTADEKYNVSDKEGNKQGGLTTIYSNLLEFDPLYLVAFWDCALSYLKDGRPSVEKIENAIEQYLEETGDIEPLFKEAFRKLDDSGFFKQKVKKFWKNMDLIEDLVEDEKEKKAAVQMIKEMKEVRKRLNK